jgi:prophage regulatory protein
MQHNADDELKRRRLVRKPIVKSISGMSGATIERKVRSGSFPRPLRIAPNCIAWRESDVLDWLDDPEAWARRHQSKDDED